MNVSGLTSTCRCGGFARWVLLAETVCMGPPKQHTVENDIIAAAGQQC
jgi:hypothetical protein